MTTPNTAQAHTAEPVAWLKEWIIDGEQRRRVDLTEESDRWMMSLDVKVTPLFAGDPSEALREAREALAEMLETCPSPKEYGEDDYIEAINKATAALTALTALTPKGAA